MTGLKIKTSRLSFLAASLCLTSWALAFTPTDYPNTDFVPETLKAIPVYKAKLGLLDIPLEKISLYDIPKKIGAGEILHRGDAGDSDYYLCYRSAVTKPQYIVISSDVMGADQLYVQSVYIAEQLGEADIKAVGNCPIFAQQFSPVELGNGLKLGDPIKKVKDIMGKASREDGAWLLYHYEGYSPGIYGFLGVKVASGKVVALYAAKTTRD